MFVMLLFGLMGLAALVIDVGFARLAQRQMQSAADFAALEGLRVRDRGDMERREHVRDVVSGFFAETPSVPSLRLEEGILIREHFHASREIRPIEESLPFEPELQLNVENAEHGDMLPVEYQVGLLVRHREGPWEDEPDLSPYHRDDRDEEREAVTPPAQRTAFLVRLRRTSESREPGVASAGPPLPYLFGTVNRAFQSESRPEWGPDLGIGVRATSIAAVAVRELDEDGALVGERQVGAAKSCGPVYPRLALADSSSPMRGLAPFVISKSDWTTWNTQPPPSPITTVRTAWMTTLQSNANEGDTTITLASAMPLRSGDFLRIEDEVLQVVEDTETTSVSVVRGMLGTNDVTHSSPTSECAVMVLRPLAIGQFLSTTPMTPSGIEPIPNSTWTVGTSAPRFATEPLTGDVSLSGELFGDAIYVALYEPSSFGEVIVGFGRLADGTETSGTNPWSWDSAGLTLQFRPSDATPKIAPENVSALPLMPISESVFATVMQSNRTIVQPILAPVLVRSSGQLTLPPIE